MRKKSLLNIVSKHINQDLSWGICEISPDYGEAMVKLTDLEKEGYIRQPVPGKLFCQGKV